MTRAVLTGDRSVDLPGKAGDPDLGTHVPVSALDALMPLHMILSDNGRILANGPTLNKICRNDTLKGHDFFGLFDVRRPYGCTEVSRLVGAENGRVRLRLRRGHHEHFKAVAVALDDGRVLLNLSLGISVVEAVQVHHLTARDFAETDLAVEMLYLVEANSAAMAESRKLNGRLQSARSQAEEQAHTDPLTGLGNRRAMEMVLGELSRAETGFALMHLDIDHFKQNNDRFGHAAGDDVLRHVAGILDAETRDGDVVVRSGGDEFVVVFPRVSDEDILRDVGRRIITRLGSRTSVEETGLGDVSVSIGLAICPVCEAAGMAQHGEQMLQLADTALYSSKRDGRGTLTVVRCTGGTIP